MIALAEHKEIRGQHTYSPHFFSCDGPEIREVGMLSPYF